MVTRGREDTGMRGRGLQEVVEQDDILFTILQDRTGEILDFRY